MGLSMVEATNVSATGVVDSSEKKSKSTKKIIAGILLIVCGGALAFFRLPPEQLNAIKSTAEQAAPANEGKLIYVNGKVVSDGVSDNLFKITSKNAALKRVVEKYQWIEDALATPPKYELGWAEGIIDSNSFVDPVGHFNPQDDILSSEEFSAKELKLGVFSMSTSQLNRILANKAFSKIKLTQADYDNLPEHGKKAFTLNLEDGSFFYGDNPASPVIGDLKVHFETFDPEGVTVLAKQQGSNLVPYIFYDKTVDKLNIGNITFEQFTTGLPNNENKIITYAFMGIGGILLLSGIVLTVAALTKKGSKSSKPVKNKKDKKDKAASAGTEIDEEQQLAIAREIMSESKAGAEGSFEAPQPAMQRPAAPTASPPPPVAPATPEPITQRPAAPIQGSSPAPSLNLNQIGGQQQYGAMAPSPTPPQPGSMNPASSGARPQMDLSQFSQPTPQLNLQQQPPAAPTYQTSTPTSLEPEPPLPAGVEMISSDIIAKEQNTQQAQMLQKQKEETQLQQPAVPPSPIGGGSSS